MRGICATRSGLINEAQVGRMRGSSEGGQEPGFV